MYVIEYKLDCTNLLWQVWKKQQPTLRVKPKLFHVALWKKGQKENTTVFQVKNLCVNQKEEIKLGTVQGRFKNIPKIQMSNFLICIQLISRPRAVKWMLTCFVFWTLWLAKALQHALSVVNRVDCSFDRSIATRVFFVCEWRGILA